VARYKLRGQAAAYQLIEGDNILGRSHECSIRFDNPLVSRRHARLLVDGEGVTFEDLGSTHGSRVNGEKFRGVRKLQTGDRITIGLDDLVLVGEETSVRPASSVLLAGGVGSGPVSQLVEKLLRQGRPDEAERVAVASIDQVLQQIRAGGTKGGDAIEEVVRRCAVVTAATKRPDALARALGLAAETAHVLGVDLIDALYGMMFIERPAVRAALEGYLGKLGALGTDLDDTLRQRLRRLETLLRYTR
jgi:pSer/pThr/pTyr-binding forkhead associated (FHA) protein